MDHKEAVRLLKQCWSSSLEFRTTFGNVESLSSTTTTTTSNNQESDDDDTSTISFSKIQIHRLCRLWGGMGYVYQISFVVVYSSESSDAKTRKSNISQNHSNTIIVKQIHLPTTSSTTMLSLGDQRKADSYLVESNFYQHLAPSLLATQNKDFTSLPIPYFVEKNENDKRRLRNNTITICMSEIHGQPSGSFVNNPKNRHDEICAVLKWLATFHGATWGMKTATNQNVVGLLQPVGSYWHLDTRLDEHQSIKNKGWQGRLKRAARAIDERLKNDPILQCCIHGDVKDANMLFFTTSINNNNNNEKEEVLQVAMYDFQYCGKSPPTKDLAYFFCVAAETNRDEDNIYLEFYHQQLIQRLQEKKNDENDDDLVLLPTLQQLKDSLELAYCDWARFMAGWGFWGTDISQIVFSVLDRLDHGTDLGSEDAYRHAIQREYGGVL